MVDYLRMKIAYVDGYKIRQTLDTDFNVIHTHAEDPTQYSPKFYIPDDEIWIDLKFKKETAHLLKVELDWFGKKTGSYHEMRKQALKKVQTNDKPPKFVIKSQKKDGMTIRYVNGSIVRKYIDPEFICGGHDLVYEYVPKNEIWIDSFHDKRDYPHILLHEMTERNLMSAGMSYDSAHEFATAAERLSRRAAGGIYPGDEGYKRGLTKTQFLQQYIKSYALR